MFQLFLYAIDPFIFNLQPKCLNWLFSAMQCHIISFFLIAVKPIN